LHFAAQPAIASSSIARAGLKIELQLAGCRMLAGLLARRVRRM
jgi:prophage tail gpP-like protein